MTEKSFSGAMMTDAQTQDGRVFKWLTFEPYTRKDGTETELSVWESACAVCGAPFTVATPRTGASKAFGRKHCDTHKLNKQEASALWSKAGKDAKAMKGVAND